LGALVIHHRASINCVGGRLLLTAAAALWLLCNIVVICDALGWLALVYLAAATVYHSTDNHCRE